MLALFMNLLIWRAHLCSAAARGHRDVLTSQGVVRGYLTPYPPYFAFLGVPYARSTHHDRFKVRYPFADSAPKAPRTWDGIFEATHRVRCPQPDGTGTEDCLILNVFSPVRANSLPVLVIVHAGGFQTGWGAFDPPTQLLAQDLVIVTFNYRLGAFGFLCLGSPEAPGNAGLKDQVAALYWVHRNIDRFGGNAYDVTVYGIGTGAASVEILLLSGVTRGLVHRAILESGSVLSPLSLTYNPMLTAIEVANNLGYLGNENTKELIKFYKELPTKKLINTSRSFLPCIENSLHSTHSLLETEPIKVFEQGIYHKVPLLVAYSDILGATSTESEIERFTVVPESFEYLLPNNLEFNNDATKQKVVELIKDFYFGNQDIDESLVKNYVEYFNDITFEYPVIKSALLHAKTNLLPVYLMKFYSSLRDTFGDNSTIDHNNIFDYFYSKDADNPVVKKLITLWINFIKIGDPTPLTSSTIPVVWQPLQAEKTVEDINMKSISGLAFDKTLSMTKSIVPNRIIFWDHIYGKFYKSHSGFGNDMELK